MECFFFTERFPLHYVITVHTLIAVDSATMISSGTSWIN